MARRTFSNLNPEVRPQIGRTLKWAVVDKLAGRRRSSPKTAPVPVVDVIEPGLVSEHAVTWLGHSTALIALGGVWTLTDPVFSASLGPGITRNAPVVLDAGGLPGLDLVLISHNHRDHLDKPSILAIEAAWNPHYVVPLEVDRYLRAWGIPGDRVTSLDWWASTHPLADRSDLTITHVPAQHWSQRGPLDRNTSLWGGYVLKDGPRQVYFAGDSGYFDGFQEIGRRFPGIDIALLPIGAYDPRWFMGPQHMDPDDAGKAMLDLGARHMVSIHWGTYKLTDEPLDEPPQRLEDWRARMKVEPERIHTLPVGGRLALMG